MQEPFDIEIQGHIYSIFPEEKDTFMVFKNGKEYLIIQKDDGNQWLKMDPESGIPLFGLDEEVNQIGNLITHNQQS